MNYIAKVYNKKYQRYTGRCMRAHGKEMVYTNFERLAENLRHNSEFYGDTDQLEVHVFTVTDPTYKFKGSTFNAKDCQHETTTSC
jgi:hypothetical protein